MTNYIGSNTLSKILLNGTPIKKAFLGAQQVFSSGPSLKSFSTKVGTSGTSMVIDAPSGISVGDLLLMTITSDGTETYTAPAGWTSYFQQYSGGGSSDTLEVFYKFADAADVAASNFTFSISSSEAHCGSMLCFTGSKDAPQGYSSGGKGSGSGSLTNSVSLAHSDGSLAVAIVAYEYPSEELTADPASNNGFTEVVDIASSVTGSTIHQRLHVYTKDIETAETVVASHAMQNLYRRIYALIEIEGA